MTWVFWSIPFIARLMIGLFFVLEGLHSIRHINKKPLFWAYLEVLSGVFLSVGFLSTIAILILLYINNRYYLKQSKDKSYQLIRLLIVNGILLLLFDPHWINSLILHFERA